MRLHVLMLLGLGLAVNAAAAQEDADPFKLSNTSFEKAAARKFAADLVQYAQEKCKSAPDFHIVGNYRKLIRIAYQLAPEDEGVLAAHARIKKGIPPDAPKRQVAPETLMKDLMPLAKAAKSGSSPDDLTAAKYLYAVGLMIDPSSDICVVNAGKQELPWSKSLDSYRLMVPDGLTSSINGLVVMTNNSTQVGQTSRILLTYRSSNSTTLSVKFLREGGGMMVVSMDEAIRYWERLRKNISLPGGTIEISFEDKFTKKDGPSAGAAYTVLMRSFSDPFKIDPAFAMTGDISVEGRILKIGGVYAKIRGALQGKCARASIPQSNEGELTDAILLNGPTTLAEIEVFGIEMIEDAVALARTDKNENLLKASTLFARLLPLVKKRIESKDPQKSAEIEQITTEILACAPRHLSAKLLQAWNGGGLPPTLSLGSSLEEPAHLFFKYLITISAKGNPSLSVIADEQSSSRISGTLRELKELKPKLHPDSKKTTQKLEEICGTISRYIGMRFDVEEKEKRIETCQKRVTDLNFKIDKARANRESNEAINRMVKQYNDAVEEQKNAVDRHAKAAQERNEVMQKVAQSYNDYTSMMKELTQDPAVLEKLIHGK